MSGLTVALLAVISLFILFILTKKSKSPVDFVLLSFNGIVMLMMILDYDYILDPINGLKVLVHFNSQFWLSNTFFIYAYSLLDNKGRIVLKGWYFVFSLPFLMFSFWDLIWRDGINAEYLRETLIHPDLIYHFFFKANKVFTIIVSFNILKQIKRHEEQLKQVLSSIENVSLKWLRNYTWMVISIYVFNLIIFLLYNFKIISEIQEAYTYFGFMSVFGTYYLSYHGVKWYSFKELHQPSTIATQVTLSESRTNENKVLFERMERLFLEDKIFIDPGLRIKDVAAKLNVPIHRLSEAINDQFGKPFYYYVAYHRCELLKEKLLDPYNDTYTILGLAIEAGFNSKASLNRTFKEQTGLTPSVFRKTKGH